MTLTEAILLGAIIGWICSAAAERFLMWVDRAPVIDDLDVTEYATHAEDVYDWSAVCDEDLAAWERELLGGTS